MSHLTRQQGHSTSARRLQHGSHRLNTLQRNPRTGHQDLQHPTADNSSHRAFRPDSRATPHCFAGHRLHPEYVLDPNPYDLTAASTNTKLNSVYLLARRQSLRHRHPDQIRPRSRHVHQNRRLALHRHLARNVHGQKVVNLADSFTNRQMAIATIHFHLRSPKVRSSPLIPSHLSPKTTKSTTIETQTLTPLFFSTDNKQLLRNPHHKHSLHPLRSLQTPRLPLQPGLLQRRHNRQRPNLHPGRNGRVCRLPRLWHDVFLSENLRRESKGLLLRRR